MLAYRLEKPKFDTEECIQSSLTFSSALKCTLRLVVYDIDPENNTKDILICQRTRSLHGRNTNDDSIAELL